jgi:DNA-binding transcriptional regulator GbsR (MarR family)
MDKKEIIKNYLLESRNVEIKFEIAWDIKENLDKILAEICLEKVILPLKENVKEFLSKENFRDFIVSYFDFGSFYITKRNWRENSKDRGIVAVAIERWNRDRGTIGLVKNHPFKVDSENYVREKVLYFYKGAFGSNQWWLIYLLNPPESFSLSLKEYYKVIITDPEKVVNDYLQAIVQILKVLENEEILELLEKVVKERKQQIASNSNQ